jgi:hypothetical protein
MSYQRALQAIHLQPTDQVAHQETIDHPQYMQELIGYDPWQNPQQAFIDTYRALDLDWVFGVPKRAIRFAPGESSRAGEHGVRYTEWGLTGSGWREEYPVHSVEEVLDFEPRELFSREGMCRALAGRRTDQALMGDAALVSGLYYTTLFQWPIMTFGWELFLTAAASEPERFQRVLQEFAKVSRLNLEMIAADGPDMIFLHDDVAMERGLVFHPDWYRRRLFPLYEELLEPLMKTKRVKVAFVSDGDYTDLLDDLVAVGFDGFIINANMNLAEIAQHIGRDHFLIGNASTAILTFGKPEDVVREVQRCLDDARPCAGHVMKATADLPHNIPLDNIRAYFRASRELSRQQ